MTPAPTDRAIDAYRNQARFNAVCQSIVARVMHENEERLEDLRHRTGARQINHVVYEIATHVAALVLQTVYENDAELREWKERCEQLTAMMLEGSLLRPMVIPIPKG